MEFIKASVPYKCLHLRKGGVYFIFKGGEMVQIFVHGQCRVRVSVYHNSYHRLHIWAQSS